MIRTLQNTEHKFWIDEMQELNFSLTGRFRDSNVTTGAVLGIGQHKDETINYYVKQKNEYRSKFDRYRILNYRHYKLLYVGDHFDVFRYFRYLLDSYTKSTTSSFFDNRNKLIVYIAINLLGLISRKIADLVAVETPEITPWKKAGKKVEAAIERIAKNSKFKTMLYNSALTIGVKGDGIWIPEVTEPEEGKKEVRIKRVMPETWFPTLRASDLQNIQEHVFAWKFSADEGRKILRRQVYGPGYIYHQANWLQDNETIGEPLSKEATLNHFGPKGLPPNVQFKNIKSNIVTHIPNLQFDEQHPFGISDYIDLKAPMDEINHRLTQVALELDKHANLSMRGPDTGKQETPVGKYFIYEADQPPPEYIQLPVQAIGVMMDEVDMLIKWVLTLSETSPGLLGLKEGAGVARAEALRIESINSSIKAMRKKLYLTEAIQKAFRDAMLLENELGIENYKIDGIVGVSWKDGLPDSEFDKAELMGIRTGNKPTLAVKDAVKYLDDEGSDEILKNLLAEASQTQEETAPPEDDINSNLDKRYNANTLEKSSKTK